jgi:predicted RNA methylase
MTESHIGGATAAPLSMRATAAVATAVVRAARQLFTDLERSRRVDAAVLRNVMEAAFGASDATGAWNWKTAYDACEAATVLFLRRYGAAMRAKAMSPAAMLPMLIRITGLLPTHTRRSEESETLQQFSTPIGLAFVASVAAAIAPADVVLEPSAGTGLLAIFAEPAGASLVLNEFAESRAGILSQLFPAFSTTQFDAAHINDHLDAGIVPSVVLMNPPFSAAVHVDRQMADASFDIGSALGRLPEGGRLVVITGANVTFNNPVWTDAFIRFLEQSRIVFSAAIDGAVFAKHGTNIDSCLTDIDRSPADDVTGFKASPGIAPNLPTLLAWVMQYVPPRRPIAGTKAAVYRDGQPVESREAVARRNRLIERSASLSPVPGALDQIIQRFGTDIVGKLTGRSRRIIRKGDRLLVETRAGSANLAETSAFMDDVKRILVFSDAGGTGRSYHADLSARNRRLQVHCLLEPGWKADAAIQGLGRTNRSNQAQPPLFRPIATDVKAEKRFLSTIARRLDTLGAERIAEREVA